MNLCIKSSPDTTTDAALEVSTSMFFIGVEIQRVNTPLTAENEGQISRVSAH